MLRRILSWILVLLSGYLIIVFIISVFGLYPTDSEIPLTNIQGVIVKNKIVYLGIGPPSNRIQSYNLRGEFIQNIKVDGGHQQYTFKIDKSRFPSTTKHSIVEKNVLEDALGSTFTPSHNDYSHSLQLINPCRYIDEENNSFRFQNKLLSNELTINKYGVNREIIKQGFFFKLYHIGYAHVINFFVILFFTVLNSDTLSKLISSKNFTIWRFILLSLK